MSSGQGQLDPTGPTGGSGDDEPLWRQWIAVAGLDDLETRPRILRLDILGLLMAIVGAILTAVFNVGIALVRFPIDIITGLIEAVTSFLEDLIGALFSTTPVTVAFQTAAGRVDVLGGAAAFVVGVAIVASVWIVLGVGVRLLAGE